MGKSKARLITANEKVRGLVDRGFDIDVELKNLGFEDKGIKKMLQDELAPEFAGSTEPVRAEGGRAAAMISASEKFEVDAAAPTFEAVRKAVTDGLFGKAVEAELSVNIPVADRERAAQILKAAGIGVTTSTSVSVDPEEYRNLLATTASSTEAAEARKALTAAVVKTTTYRVKYEKL